MSVTALQANPEAVRAPAVAPERKPYSKPKLKCYGSVSELAHFGVAQNSLIDGIDDR